MQRRTVAIPSNLPGGLEATRSGHFGHCEVFTLVHIENGSIQEISLVNNPPHVQGGCQGPVNLLYDSKADAIIVGGIGMRPLMGFRQVGIEVYHGPEGETVGTVVDHLLQGKLSLIADHQVCGGGAFPK